MNDEMKKRLASKSGDSNSSRPPKYVCPLIRFDGNRGEFRKITKDGNNENVEEALTKPLKFVILKKRRLLSAFSPTCSYFTSEHNSTSDKLMLFKVVSGTVSLETTGFTDELREKYQVLKTHEVVYVLYDGEVCKMEIKGGSLGGYYDYQKALSSEEKHSFEVSTIVSSEKAKSEGGFSYFKMTFDFENDESTNFEEVETKMDEVIRACEESDAYTKQKLNEKTRGSSTNGDLSIDEASRIKAIRESATKAEKEFNEYNDEPKKDTSEDIPF